MRTARLLKYIAYGVIILGIFIASNFFIPSTIEFWIVIFISIILWFFLRLIANTAQIIYDMKVEVTRILGNIERAIYYSNSIAKEIKDLIESDKK